MDLRVVATVLAVAVLVLGLTTGRSWLAIVAVMIVVAAVAFKRRS